MSHASSKFWVSVTENPGMAKTYHAAFRVPDGPPRWVTERGNRRVFTNRAEASLAGHETMVDHLNGAEGEAGRSKSKADAKIRSFREGKVDKDRRRRLLKATTAEADTVFVNFKG